MVHSVQCGRRRRGDPRRVARRRRQPARARLAVVAAHRAAGRVSILRDRGDHRFRRFVERQHRRGGRLLGKAAPASRRPRRLYCARDRCRRFSSHRARHRRYEFLRRRHQSAVLASALFLRRTQIPARMRINIMTAALLDVHALRQSFPRADGGEHLVLDGVDLALSQGQIVGLLGRTGSGKSTLLRLIAGLAQPSGGTVTYLGKPVDAPAEGIAMVFQSFALFPWLTVLENVQLGLEALGLPEPEIRKRALAAIDLIGLDGYESAFPRELSGGMRQLVGFARALVVHPNILLMDEPFSALDVLTAETLRTDFLELWGDGKLPIKGVILVTHNIEEAVLMCDRILLFSNNPGRIIREIGVDLKQPRNRLDPQFRDLVEKIYVAMTQRRGAAQTGPERQVTI